MEQNDKTISVDTLKHELTSLNTQFSLLIKQTGKFDELKELRERIKKLEHSIKLFAADKM